MSWLSRLLRRERSKRKRLEMELEEEIQFHLQMRQQEYQSRGMPPEGARQAAVERFGNLDAAKRRLLESARARDRRLHFFALWDSLRADLRWTWRKASGSPFFTALEISTIALGIALTTGTFTLVDRVLLRPLPFADPEGLVTLHSMNSDGQLIAQTSSQNWHDWRQQNRSLDRTALVHFEQRLPTLDRDRTEYARTRAVTGAFFEILRPTLVRGRIFTESEAGEQPDLALVSEGFWQRFLEGSPILPLSLRVSDRTVRIIGVVESDQVYPAGTDLWLAEDFPPRGDGTRNNINFHAIGRLRAGVTRTQAEEDLSTIARRILERAPNAVYSHGVSVRPLRESIVGEEAPQTLWLLFSASLFVLLVAGANLAGLNLSRARADLKDTAIRVALGAGSPRLLQQLLTRHATLASVGGILGILLAWVGTNSLVMRSGLQLPRSAEVELDGRIVVMAVAWSLITGFLAGSLPAWRILRTPFRLALASRASRAWRHRDRTGRLLVAAEIALCMLLVTTSGLLVRNFQKLLDRDLGFDPRGVVAVEVRLTNPTYFQPTVRVDYWKRAVAALAARPEIDEATVAKWVPALGDSGTFLEVEGFRSDKTGARYRIVGDDYFSTMKISLLAGRAFGPGDQAGSERVAIVNKALADRYFAGGQAIGRRLRAVSMEQGLDGSAPPWLRIVGVAANIRHWGFESAPEPEVYTYYQQLPPLASTLTTDMYLIARSQRIAPAQLTRSIQDTVREIDRELAADPVYLAGEVEDLMRNRRLLMLLVSTFGMLALALATLGVYGITAFSVAQRTREIGVRISVGASRNRVLRLILGEVFGLTLVGVFAGFAGTFWLGHFTLVGDIPVLEAFLVEIRPGDPASHVFALALLLASVLLAALAPALSACRIDPVRALRAEQ